MSLLAWSHESGISRSTLITARMKRNGGSIEAAINTDKRTAQTVNVDGVKRTLAEHAEHCGVNINTLTGRLRSGMSIERASIPAKERATDEITAFGKTMRLTAWAQYLDISRMTLTRRLAKLGTIEASRRSRANRGH